MSLDDILGKFVKPVLAAASFSAAIGVADPLVNNILKNTSDASVATAEAQPRALR